MRTCLKVIGEFKVEEELKRRVSKLERSTTERTEGVEH
jgi:hypothetical protein